MNISNIRKQFILLIQSFGYAFAGCKTMWLTEFNFRIHVLISLLVCSLGLLLNLIMIEWVGISLCIAMVIGAEVFNTAIEHLCDLISKEIKPEIKIIKDISAFGVLFVTIISIIVGIIIFLPKVIYIFKSI